MPDTENAAIKKSDVSEKKDSFFSGLFSLMTKQCIISALFLCLIYILKSINFSFTHTICSFIKSIICYDMTPFAVKNMITGLFI